MAKRWLQLLVVRGDRVAVGELFRPRRHRSWRRGENKRGHGEIEAGLQGEAKAGG